MSRVSSDYWNCVVCGKSTYGLICYDCAGNEKSRQKAEPGSLTHKQYSYIEHLISKLDTDTTRKIIFDAVPDFDGDLELLSANQAGALIAKLLEFTNEVQGQKAKA